MDEFNEDELLKELSEVCKKYELKNCIFAGINNKEKMIGLFCVETYGRGHSLIESMMSFANAARMYQSAREHILKMFDKI